MTIITTKKPFEEVLAAIKNTKKIGIVSCGSCAAMCQTGGEEGAKEMAEKLEQEGFEIKVVIVPDEVCDNRVMMKDFRKIDEDLQNIDAILTLSCGLGVASITKVLERKYPHIPVFIANNTRVVIVCFIPICCSKISGKIINWDATRIPLTIKKIKAKSATISCQK